MAYVHDTTRAQVSENTVVSTDLSHILGASDIVVVALPHTAKTHHLIDSDRIQEMRANAMIINVGRGATIAQDDLLDALKSRRIRKAYLDVVENRTVYMNHPIYGVPNLVYTSHSAAASRSFNDEMLLRFIENLKRYQRGESLLGQIDLSSGY
jgi:phosphoglycerate dehydrogenase-like enzyme